MSGAIARMKIWRRTHARRRQLRLKFERGAASAYSVENIEAKVVVHSSTYEDFAGARLSQPITHAGESIPEQFHAIPSFTTTRYTATRREISVETATVLATTAVEGNGCARYLNRYEGTKTKTQGDQRRGNVHQNETLLA